jgi:hypothetical protein
MGELLLRHTQCMRSSRIFRPSQRIFVAVIPGFTLFVDDTTALRLLGSR